MRNAKRNVMGMSMNQCVIFNCLQLPTKNDEQQNEWGKKKKKKHRKIFKH